MILNDTQIRILCRDQGMIRPFVEKQMGSPSFGLSSFGYDIRVGNEFKIFQYNSNAPGVIVDPRNFNPQACVDVNAGDDNRGFVIVPPHSFALARSVETFKIPRDVLAICVGKSTYARCGLIVNVTPLEPEWEGVLTLEISNTTPLPAKVIAGHGIAQLLFLQGESCEYSYADKKGKYQGQTGIVLPR